MPRFRGDERLYVCTEEISGFLVCLRPGKRGYANAYPWRDISVPLVMLATGLGVLLDGIHCRLKSVLNVLADFVLVSLVDDLCLKAHDGQQKHKY